jgi:hypothetical protein
MPEPALDRAVAALREFLHRSGALRAQALIDAGPDSPPALVACSRLGPIEIVIGDRELELPHGMELDAEPPDLGDVRQMPPFQISIERGEVTGTIGGLQHLAAAVSRLAEAIGGRTVAVVEFETTSADVPLALSARSGEAVVVTLGEETYEL